MTTSAQNNIIANTIEFTYKGTTRPITFVKNTNCRFDMEHHNIALILWTFRDMIPDYQDYVDMRFYYNFYHDKQIDLKLPVKQWNYTVETLGHGEITGILPNHLLKTSYYIEDIKEGIAKEVGIRKELIKLLDMDGNEINDRVKSYDPNIKLFAVFESMENKMEEKGIKQLEYRSTFKNTGNTMTLWKSSGKDRLYDLNLISFKKKSNYIVRKRTPKQVVITNTTDNTTYRKKIKVGPWGEYVRIKDYVVVMDDSSINYDSPYLCPKYK